MKRPFLILAAASILLAASSLTFCQESPAAAPHQRIPFKNSEPQTDEYGTRIGSIVLTVLLLASLGLYLGRRQIPVWFAFVRKNDGRLLVVSRLSLAPRTTLYLVKLDSREFLLATHGERLVRLEMPAVHVADSGTSTAGTVDDA